MKKLFRGKAGLSVGLLTLWLAGAGFWIGSSQKPDYRVEVVKIDAEGKVHLRFENNTDEVVRVNSSGPRDYQYTWVRPKNYSGIMTGADFLFVKSWGGFRHAEIEPHSSLVVIDDHWEGESGERYFVSWAVNGKAEGKFVGPPFFRLRSRISNWVDPNPFIPISSGPAKAPSWRKVLARRIHGPLLLDDGRIKSPEFTYEPNLAITE